MPSGLVKYPGPVQPRWISMKLFRANVDLDVLRISAFTLRSVLCILVDDAVMRHWDAEGTSGKSPRQYLKIKPDGFNDVDADASASGVVVVGGSLFVNARLFQFYDLWRKGAATDDRQRRVGVAALFFLNNLQGGFLFRGGSFRRLLPPSCPPVASLRHLRRSPTPWFGPNPTLANPPGAFLTVRNDDSVIGATCPATLLLPPCAS